MRSKLIALIFACGIVAVGLTALTSHTQGQGPAPPAFSPNIPKTWDDTSLADWATPVAGLNVRPTHISEEEYYSLAIDNLRTYPVYFPGREPEGYWEMLQHVEPKPLIEPEKLKTEAHWMAAGRGVFEELDLPQMRTFDPKLIAAARSREGFPEPPPKGAATGVRWTPPDGIATDLRWVPTKRGVALSLLNCSGCHVLHRSDGTIIAGAPRLAEVSRTRQFKFRGVDAGYLESPNRVLRGAPPFVMGGETFGIWLYQAYGVPWVKDDANGRLKNIAQVEYNALLAAERRGGAITRWNGSLLYPAKIADLIGIKDRKYLDHTATHLHRGIGDLMRYSAQVSFAEMTDFGPYHVLAPDTKRVQARLSDEALYALASYLYSLQPPPNLNPFDEKAKAGQKVFAREGCPICHTPPLYTSNKVTLAQGFTPPKDAPATLDILQISVGTDPGLALDTRKGTGYYKVPSLKGVWYRGHHLHDGSVASLEEMFDPDRLKETHVPRMEAAGYEHMGDQGPRVRVESDPCGASAAHRILADPLVRDWSHLFPTLRSGRGVIRPQSLASSKRSFPLSTRLLRGRVEDLTLRVVRHPGRIARAIARRHRPFLNRCSTPVCRLHARVQPCGIGTVN